MFSATLIFLNQLTKSITNPQGIHLINVLSLPAGDSSGPSSYVCLCDEYFTGRHCDVPIEDDDECIDSDELGNSSDEDGSGSGSGSDEDGSGSGEEGSGEDGDTYDCESSNPCTDENIKEGNFYHPHHDSTSFVQCDEHGGCFVRDCPKDTEWDQDALTCVHARARKEQNRDDVMDRIQTLKRLLDELNDELGD